MAKAEAPHLEPGFFGPLPGAWVVGWSTGEEVGPLLGWRSFGRVVAALFVSAGMVPVRGAQG